MQLLLIDFLFQDGGREDRLKKNKPTKTEMLLVEAAE